MPGRSQASLFGGDTWENAHAPCWAVKARGDGISAGPSRDILAQLLTATRVPYRFTTSSGTFSIVRSLACLGYPSGER